MLLLKETVTAVVAVPAKETVQVTELFAPKLAGEHDSVLSCAGATRFSVLVKDAPPPLAVRIAV